MARVSFPFSLIVFWHGFMNKIFLLCMCFVVFTWADQAHADDFIQWHTSNIQVLKGAEYRVGDRNRTVITTEHAHGHAYGDNFIFVDWIWPHDGKPTFYGEFAPRISMSKVFNTDLSAGPIKDFLLSGMIEKPNHRKVRYLYGGAVDFNVQGFKFFKTNLYVRDNPDLRGKTWQVTLVWNRPFQIGNTSWVAEGFADFAGAEGRTQPHQFIVPRFLLDVGKIAGHQEGKLWAGVEYSYWHNKFGIDGVTESHPQLQVKWVF